MVKKNLSRRDFVTLKSIGNYCMVSTTTVRRWIKQGQLHAVQLPGGHYRVTVQDLINFLKQNNLPISKELMETG